MSQAQFTKGVRIIKLDKICFICEKPLVSQRAIYGKTETCSTDCGVIWRDIKQNRKIFATEYMCSIDWSKCKTEYQSFLDWDKIALKTDVKALYCIDCNVLIGLKKSAQLKRCSKCRPIAQKRYLAKSKQMHKLKMKTDLNYRLKSNARRSSASHKRRTKLNVGDVIDLYELAKRDNWMCGLCHKKINKRNKHKAKKLHLRGPSMDHILPLSKGGLHTWDNVQLAHYICNSLRGNKEINAK